MAHFDDDIFELINEHKKNIKNSFLFYRPLAKIHKMNVLSAATKYLACEITKDQFLSIISKNKQYSDAFRVSLTKKLIEVALKETPSPYRSKKGYVRSPS